MDDAGIYLMQRKGEGLWHRFTQKFGAGLLNSAAPLMRILTVVGTIAMFLVGGGILMHGIPFLHHLTEYTDHWVGNLPTMTTVAGALVPTFINLIVGAIAGALIVALVATVGRLRPAKD